MTTGSSARPRGASVGLEGGGDRERERAGSDEAGAARRRAGEGRDRRGAGLEGVHARVQLRRRDPGEDPEPQEPKEKIVIKLAEGKELTIKSMSTSLFYFQGQPVTAEEFIEKLFNTITLPDILKSEEELREPVSYTHLTLPTSDLV